MDSVGDLVSGVLVKFALEFQFQKPIDFQRRHFQNDCLVAILDFLFPYSNFSLALNINSKLKWYNTYVYV